MELEQFLPQLERQYKKWVKDRIAGQGFSPFALRGLGKPPEKLPELMATLRFFQSHEKNKEKLGWKITWRNIQHPVAEKQLWPAKIELTTPEDLIHLSGQQHHWQAFEQQLLQLLDWKPALSGFLEQKPDWVLKYSKQWPLLMQVTYYLLQNDVSDFYLRSIPVSADTKFIENHQTLLLELLALLHPGFAGYPTLEEALHARPKNHFHFPLRFLDRQLAEASLGPIDSLALTHQELQKLEWPVKRIIVVENEISFLHLNPLPDTLALWGKGLAVLSLHSIPLFEKAAILYWGDLDEEGYRMLNGFRSLYPQTQSLLMDESCLNTNQGLLGLQGNPYGACNYPLLKEEEKRALENLSTIQGRLEQEKIPLQMVTHALEKWTSYLK